jgi:hypothetical protein
MTINAEITEFAERSLEAGGGPFSSTVPYSFIDRGPERPARYRQAAPTRRQTRHEQRKEDAKAGGCRQTNADGNGDQRFANEAPVPAP